MKRPIEGIVALALLGFATPALALPAIDNFAAGKTSDSIVAATVCIADAYGRMNERCYPKKYDDYGRNSYENKPDYGHNSYESKTDYGPGLFCRLHPSRCQPKVEYDTGSYSFCKMYPWKCQPKYETRYGDYDAKPKYETRYGDYDTKPKYETRYGDDNRTSLLCRIRPFRCNPQRYPEVGSYDNRGTWGNNNPSTGTWGNNKNPGTGTWGNNKNPGTGTWGNNTPGNGAPSTGCKEGYGGADCGKNKIVVPEKVPGSTTDKGTSTANKGPICPGGARWCGGPH